MDNTAWIIIFSVLVVATILRIAAEIRLINSKNREYLNKEVHDAVCTAVSYIQQVYVDKAKANRSFESGGRNQKEALALALECSTRLLSPAAIRHLHRGRTDSKVKDQLTALIEETIRNRNAA